MPSPAGQGPDAPMPVAQTAPSPGYSGPPAGNQYQYDPRAQVVMMGRWKNDLCDCLNNCSLSCTTAFCPSCMLAQVAGRLRKYLCFGTFKTFLFCMIMGQCLYYGYYFECWNYDVNVGWKCDANGFSYLINFIWQFLAVCWFFSIIYALYMLRGEVRRRRQIAGNEGEDLLLSVFCFFLTLCQLATEVEADDRCCNVNEPEALPEDGVHYSTQPYVNPDASGYSKV